MVFYVLPRSQLSFSKSFTVHPVPNDRNFLAALLFNDLLTPIMICSLGNIQSWRCQIFCLSVWVPFNFFLVHIEHGYLGITATYGFNMSEGMGGTSIRATVWLLQAKLTSVTCHHLSLGSTQMSADLQVTYIHPVLPNNLLLRGLPSWFTWTRIINSPIFSKTTAKTK